MISFLGSGLDRGQSPVEWGEIPSIHPSIHLSVPPLAGPQTLLAGLQTPLAGPQTLLAGPHTPPTSPQIPPASPRTPKAGPQTAGFFDMRICGKLFRMKAPHVELKIDTYMRRWSFVDFQGKQSTTLLENFVRHNITKSA